MKIFMFNIEFKLNCRLCYSTNACGGGQFRLCVGVCGSHVFSFIFQDLPAFLDLSRFAHHFFLCHLHDLIALLFIVHSSSLLHWPFCPHPPNVTSTNEQDVVTSTVCPRAPSQTLHESLYDASTMCGHDAFLCGISLSQPLASLQLFLSRC